jgi:hypothetical protein
MVNAAASLFGVVGSRDDSPVSLPIGMTLSMQTRTGTRIRCSVRRATISRTPLSPVGIQHAGPPRSKRARPQPAFLMLYRWQSPVQRDDARVKRPARVACLLWSERGHELVPAVSDDVPQASTRTRIRQQCVPRSGRRQDARSSAGK